MKYKLFLKLLLFTSPLFAKSLMQLSFDVMEKQQNCVASESFARKVEIQINDRQLADVELKSMEKTAYRALLTCAKEQGISSLESENSLYKALQACPEAYQAWVQQAPARVILNQELKDLQSELSRIKRFIKHSCVAMN